MGLRGDADVAEVSGRVPGREFQAAKERRRQVTGVAADPGPFLVDVMVPTRVHSGRLKKSSNRKKTWNEPPNTRQYGVQKTEPAGSEPA
jgi:hypothetical protein